MDWKMMGLNAFVLETREITRCIYSMTLECPSIAETAIPGQFVHIAVATQGSSDPLLRRPVSICDVDRSLGSVEIVFRTVGKGTSLLARVRAGERVDLMGPIGRGFRLPCPGQSPLVIAGGIGIAPLHFLCKTLCSSRVAPYVLAGFSTSSDVALVDRLLRYGAQVQVVTEDGSSGLRGRVTEHIGCAVNQMSALLSGDIEVYACGPNAMIHSVQEWCLRSGVSGQVSLESRMACGTGACLGCVQRVITDSGEQLYERVCVDGPVFDIQRVVICQSCFST